MSNAADDPRSVRRLREGEFIEIGPSVLRVSRIQRGSVTLVIDGPADVVVSPVRRPEESQ